MNAVLQEFSVGAYRGLSGLVLDRLTPVSLVVGANNCGKSSILEAAGIFFRPADSGQWLHTVRQRASDVPLVEGLWSIFPGTEVLHPEEQAGRSDPILLAGTIGGQARSVRAECSATQNLGADEVANLSARVEVSVNSEPAIQLKFPVPGAINHHGWSLRVFSANPATHYSTKTMVEHLSRVVDEGRKALAVDVLQIFDPAVEDIDVSVPAGRESIRISHATRGVVDLASFGDGMRRSMALALGLTRASQGLLLIDEIESGIHPGVLRSVVAKLLTAAATSEVQVLATTHSLEAVDAVIGSVEDRGAPEELSAFWVKRQDGKHEVRCYDFAKLCTLREGGLDIR